MNSDVYTGDLPAFHQQQQLIRQQTQCRNLIDLTSEVGVSRWLIVGAGGFGREVYSWTQAQIHKSRPGITIEFLDDNPDCLSKFPALQSHLAGSIQEYVPSPGDRLLMAIADPPAKLDTGSELLSRGAQFASYVHPTAILSEDCTIGVGSIICPFAVVCCNVRIGDFVSMNVGALAGHDSIVGQGCTLSPHSNVAGQAILEQGVFLGCQTVILPKVRVGEFARIGAGSAVISSVKPRSTMIGVPAKRINWSKSHDSSEQKAA